MFKQRAETAGVHLILIAYCLLAIGPILIFGWLAQRQLVRGLTFGAVK